MTSLRRGKNLLLGFRALLLHGCAVTVDGTVSRALDSAVVKELISAYTMLCKERLRHLIDVKFMCIWKPCILNKCIHLVFCVCECVCTFCIAYMCIHVHMRIINIKFWFPDVALFFYSISYMKSIGKYFYCK